MSAIFYNGCMIQQQIIKSAISRTNYIRAHGQKYKDKESEKVFSFGTHGLSMSDTLSLFKQLDNEKTSKSSRSAREIIVPIPYELNAQQQKDYVEKFITMFRSVYQLDDKNFLYMGAVHNKIGKNGKLNHHLHFLFSERPFLKDPKIEKVKTRWYLNGKQVKAHTEGAKQVKGYERKTYFGNKFNHLSFGKNKENRSFDDINFCKHIDMVWGGITKAVMGWDLEKINNTIGNNPELMKSKHIGCKDDSFLFKKGAPHYDSKINQSKYKVMKYNRSVKFINEEIRKNPNDSFIMSLKENLKNNAINRNYHVKKDLYKLDPRNIELQILQINKRKEQEKQREQTYSNSKSKGYSR